MRTPSKIHGHGKCPECFSDYVVLAGFAYTSEGKKQRYLCADCRRFTLYPLPQRHPSKETASA